MWMSWAWRTSFQEAWNDWWRKETEVQTKRIEGTSYGVCYMVCNRTKLIVAKELDEGKKGTHCSFQVSLGHAEAWCLNAASEWSQTLDGQRLLLQDASQIISGGNGLKVGRLQLLASAGVCHAIGMTHLPLKPSIPPPVSQAMPHLEMRSCGSTLSQCKGPPHRRTCPGARSP